MKDVAASAGVSVMTVSRAFRADASVGEDTRQRIRQVAEAMGYVFDATASNLRSQKTGFVAVTVPSINNANFAGTVGALSRGLEEAGLQVLLGATNYNVTDEERLIEQLLRRRPEAIVVTGGRHTDRARKLLESAGIPVVETWDLPENPIDHVVGFSNAATMQTMVDHLVGRGYTRLGFIGGDDEGDTRGADRRRGFLAALARHGLPAHRLSPAGAPPVSMREGADAMARLYRDHPDTQAVVCVSDLSAFGALTECQRMGLAVPQDMAIAGFGAYEISAITVPTLTTIDPYPEAIGHRAADLIIRLLAADTPLPPQRIEVQPSLDARGST
jgi:LacI family gluconate utilization system Gnt-I transcriptional repressor